METSFYELYNTYEQSELFEVLFHSKDYQPDAIACAQRVLHEKGWDEAYKKLLEEGTDEINERNEEQEEDTELKAEFYRKEVEIKTQHHPFRIPVADVQKFETALNKTDIEYLNEDEYQGTIPIGTKTFYFKSEDVLAIDRLCKQLGIIVKVAAGRGFY